MKSKQVTAAILSLLMISAAIAVGLIVYRAHSRASAAKAARQEGTFRLTFENSFGAGSYEVQLVFRQPCQWRAETALAWNVSVCDGSKVWQFSDFKRVPDSIHVSDLSKIREYVDPDLANRCTWAHSSQGLILPVDPNHEKWSKHFKGWTKNLGGPLEFIVEEDVGGTPCLRYRCIDEESDGTTTESNLWFGKVDGIVRQQTIAFGSSRSTLVVKQIQVDAEVDEKVFTFIPPRDAKVVDETSVMIELIKKGRLEAKE